MSSSTPSNTVEVNPFEVRGKLTVRNSSTVICVRQREPNDEVLEEREQGFVSRFKSKFGVQDGSGRSPFVESYLTDSDFEFTSNWEVLLGQSEVINWLKSTPEKLSVMRYAGEFKLAGGNVDKGETVEAAAKRELAEEFLRPAETQVPPEEIKLRPFSVKQTRPIRSRSNLMFNFVAIAEENPWLNNLNIDEVNLALEERRQAFFDEIRKPDSKYFSYDKSKKEELSPEVYQLRWVPLEEAFEHCLTSVVPDVFVNEWQEREFNRLGRKHRDPLIMTGATLIELESFPSVGDLLDFCQNVNHEQLCREEQWLFDGMTNEEVVKVFKARLGVNNTVNPSFLPLSMVADRRAMRAKKRKSSL